MNAKPAVRVVDKGLVLSSTYAGLEIDPDTDPSRQSLVASVVRRLCGIMCPCAPFLVLRAARESLAPLFDDAQALDSQLDEALEDLIVAGDVLELSKIAAGMGDDRTKWLYCAPPSFVVRSAQRVHIFGVAPDDAAFLPSELRKGLERLGASRFLETSDTAAMRTTLRQFGLREISKEDWLVTVRAEPAPRYIERARRKLASDGAPGDLPELVVLTHAGATAGSYRSRWRPVVSETGLYVGRSPQPYGQPLWYLCDLAGGQVKQSILLPFGEAKDRASDAAWRLQLAIDAIANRPSTFECRPHEGGFRLQFHFPLPLAARRRLEYLGGRTRAGLDSPFAFWVPASELEAEKKFLHEHYWLEAVMQEN